MAKTPAPEKDRQQRFAELLLAAFDGRLDWLDDLVLAAGYARPGPDAERHVVRQVDLIEMLPKLTRSCLLNWEALGLPSRKVRGQKSFDLVELLRFFHARFIGPGRRPGKESELLEATIEKERWTGANKKLDWERKSAVLIPRSEADRTLAATILQIRASLLSMAHTLAPQLEHRTAEQVAATVEANVRWLCNEAARGRVHIPAPIRAHLDAAIKKFAAAQSADAEREEA